MYSNYSSSGRCTSSGVAQRIIGRDQFSRTNYDNFNLYPSNNYYNEIIISIITLITLANPTLITKGES